MEAPLAGLEVVSRKATTSSRCSPTKATLARVGGEGHLPHQQLVGRDEGCEKGSVIQAGGT